MKKTYSKYFNWRTPFTKVLICTFLPAVILSGCSHKMKGGPWLIEEYSPSEWLAGQTDSPAGKAVSAGNPENWKMTFQDEFDGEAIDRDLWKIVQKDEDRRYHQDHAYLEEGSLILSVGEIDGEMRAARIDTRETFSQKYGVFETRVKLGAIEDTIFALWMSNYPGVNKVGNDGRDGSEIDIIETGFADDSVIHTFHWDGYDKHHQSHSTGKLPIGIDIHEGWHIFGARWDEKEVSFYVDGILTAKYSGPGVPQVEEFIILSSENQKHWEGSIKNAELPVRFEVDWVRGYERL